MSSSDMLPGHEPRLSRFVMPVVCVLSVIAGGLSAIQAVSLEPTLDESFSWRLARYRTSDLLLATARDVHPPLHYLMLKMWRLIFGDHILALRSLSLVMRVASVGLMFHTVLAASVLIRRSSESHARSQAAGILSAALLTLSPDHIEAGASARMYSQIVLLALASHYFFFRALYAPQSSAWWLSYGATLGASCLTHNGGVLLVCSHGVAAALLWLSIQTSRATGESSQRPSIPVRGIMLAGLTAAAIYGPWIPMFLWQAGVVSRGYWIGPLGVVQLVETFQPWLTGIPFSGRRLAVLVAIPHLILMLRVMACHPVGRVISLHALFPWALVVSVSYYWETSILQQRYLLFAHVALILAWGLGLFVLRSGPARLITVWFLVSATVYGMTEASVETRWSISSSMDVLRQKARHGDLILVSARHVNLVRYHLVQYRMEAFPVVGVTEAPPGTKLHVVHEASLQPAEIVRSDQLASLSADRLWMLTFPGYAPWGPPFKWVESHRVVGADDKPYTLTLYQPEVNPQYHEE